MRLYRQEDVEIARRSATHARFAFTGKADACAILHASRDVDGERTLFLRSTRAMTIGARLVDGLAAPVAGRAGAFNGEEALRRPHLAITLTGWTGDRLRAGRRARAGADITRNRTRHADLRLLAFKGFFQCDFHIVAQIMSARLAAAAPSAAASPAAHELAEKIVENVGHGGTAKATLRTACAEAATHAAVKSGMAELVIGGPALLILQRVIGLIEFL